MHSCLVFPLQISESEQTSCAGSGPAFDSLCSQQKPTLHSLTKQGSRRMMTQTTTTRRSYQIKGKDPAAHQVKIVPLISAAQMISRAVHTPLLGHRRRRLPPFHQQLKHVSRHWNSPKGHPGEFEHPGLTPEKPGTGQTPGVPTPHQFLPISIQVLHCQHLGFLELDAPTPPATLSFTFPAAPGEGPMPRRFGTATPSATGLSHPPKQRTVPSAIAFTNDGARCGCASNANELRADFASDAVGAQVSRLPDPRQRWPPAPSQPQRARKQRGELIGNQQRSPATLTQGEEQQHQPEPLATRLDSQRIFGPDTHGSLAHKEPAPTSYLHLPRSFSQAFFLHLLRA